MSTFRYAYKLYQLTTYKSSKFFENLYLLLYIVELLIYKGVLRNSKGGETEGEGRKLRKIHLFCEILNKISQKGGAKDRRPPLCTPIITDQYLSGKRATFLG